MTVQAVKEPQPVTQGAIMEGNTELMVIADAEGVQGLNLAV